MDRPTDTDTIKSDSGFKSLKSDDSYAMVFKPKAVYNGMSFNTFEETAVPKDRIHINTMQITDDASMLTSDETRAIFDARDARALEPENTKELNQAKNERRFNSEMVRKLHRSIPYDQDNVFLHATGIILNKTGISKTHHSLVHVLQVA